MGLVFRPQARRTALVGLVKIDSSHPSATALNAFVLHGSRQGADADLCSGGLAPWIEASATVSKGGMTGFGPSRNFPAKVNAISAGGDFVQTKTSDPSTGTGDFTIGGQFIFNTRTASNYTEIFGQSDDAVNKYLDVYITASGDLIAEGNAINLVLLAGGPVVGVPYTAFFTRLGTTVTAILNGVLASTTTSSVSLYDSTFKAHYGAWGTGFPSTPDDFDLLWSAGWNRALSLDEIVALTSNPYDFLIPAEGEMPALFVAAAGGSFIPAWAMNSNLPVIGTGTY